MKQVASFAGWAGTCVFFSKNKAIADHAALEDVRWKGPLQRGSSMGLHSYIVLSRCFPPITGAFILQYSRRVTEQPVFVATEN